MLRQVPVAINKNKQVSREVNKFCWSGAKKSGSQNTFEKAQAVCVCVGGWISFSNIEYCY